MDLSLEEKFLLFKEKEAKRFEKGWKNCSMEIEISSFFDESSIKKIALGFS